MLQSDHINFILFCFYKVIIVNIVPKEYSVLFLIYLSECKLYTQNGIKLVKLGMKQINKSNFIFVLWSFGTTCDRLG